MEKCQCNTMYRSTNLDWISWSKLQSKFSILNPRNDSDFIYIWVWELGRTNHTLALISKMNLMKNCGSKTTFVLKISFLQGLQAQSWIFDLLIKGWKIDTFCNLRLVFKSLLKHNFNDISWFDVVRRFLSKISKWKYYGFCY